MRRDRSKAEQQSRRRRIEFLTSDQAPAEERGKAVLFLLAHACAYLLLIAAEATWAVITGVRVWRRRQTGLAASVRSGAHSPRSPSCSPRGWPTWSPGGPSSRGSTVAPTTTRHSAALPPDTTGPG